MSLKIRTLWFEPSMELTVLSPTSNEANLLKPWIVMSSFLHNVILSIDFFPNKEHANIPQHSSSRLLFAKEISARLKVLHRKLGTTDHPELPNLQPSRSNVFNQERFVNE
mmetsp:Transcript_7305/g.17008  ORF Transcript_7305/g.17008 Transcript_7305/m.17008 type:complete len:110 (+) Transcript_7305:78-407(+)